MAIDLTNTIGETTDYDKKQELEVKKPKSWCKSISAFANGRGGKLIFGIADDGEIVGIDNPQNTSEKYSEILKDKVDSVPEVNLHLKLFTSLIISTYISKRYKNLQCDNRVVYGGYLI